MENISKLYIPIGHVVKKNYKTIGIRKFIKENKVMLMISSISLALLSTYVVLIINFINLIRIIN